jgi:hypothetical protein
MYGYIAISRLPMERITIMNTLGILSGKQKEYNIQILTTLYDNGPFTAWELTNKLTDTNKHSLHATLNKRLHKLERKGYIQKDGKTWVLRYKGIIANLLIQPTPRIWNAKWKERFNRNAKAIEKEAIPILGFDSERIQEYLKMMGVCLDDFQTWIDFTHIIKKLMENGVINFDEIKESTLMGLVILEAKSLEEISSILHPKDVKRSATPSA